MEFQHKVLVPQRPGLLVSRPRLTDLLRSAAERRLIALTAPPGYGKTTLLIDFAHTVAPLPVCWYTLDTSDQDPWEFLRYLAAAIEQRFPGAARQTNVLLHGRGRPPFASAAGALLRDVDALGQHFVLVIDDWHLVDQVSDIGEVVAQLLLRCPNCHLILASRIYPSLPDIMLLAARRQMIGMDEEPLRFTPEEVAAVLGAEFHAPVPFEQAQALAERSNGWITGILLAVQASGYGAVARPSGQADRQVYQFLAEQVFDRLSDQMRWFLLDAALLDELTADRCDRVFGRDDSGRMLEALLRQRLFVAEIKPGVLRFHPLFREFLQEQYRIVDPQRYRAVVLQVVEAHLAQREWSLAFDMCVAAGDTTTAQRVVALGGEQLYVGGRMETLERWFGALPQDELDTPLLCLKARVLLDRRHAQEAQVLADIAGARAEPAYEALVKLLQAQLARIGGRYEQAMRMAGDVLARAQEGGQRAQALRTLGICFYRTARPEAAIEHLRDALAVERQRGDIYAMANLQHDLAVCYIDMGRLGEAEQYYSQADACWATLGNVGLQAMSLNSKGVVQHLAGRYREAHDTLRAALALAHEAAVTDYQSLIQTSLGDLYSDLQLWSRADEAYGEARRLGGSAHLMAYVDMAGAWLLVRQGQFEPALRAIERLPDEPGRPRSPGALLLRAAAAAGLRRYAEASCDVQEAIEQLARGGGAIDLLRAYLTQAQIAAGQASDGAALIEPLDRAAAVANRAGSDAFLVTETMHMPLIARRAQAAGWARASDWPRRHQQIRQLAQRILHDDQRPALAVWMFGADEIALDGRPVELGWLKAREVLYYLLAHPSGATPEVLREAIWPNLSADRSRSALKAAIFQLRSALPRELIELHNRQVYRVNRAAAWIDCDVEAFLLRLDSRADDVDGLFEAIDLYRGPYLPWSDNDWSGRLRSYLEQRYLNALRAAAERCWQDQAHTHALMLYRRILAQDPLDEAAHAGVMRCQIALGNRAAAITQYQALRRALDEELGLEVGQSSEVERLYHTILNSP